MVLPVVLNSWWAVYLFCCGRGSKERRLPKWEKEGRRTQYTQLLATEKFTQVTIYNSDYNQPFEVLYRMYFIV